MLDFNTRDILQKHLSNIQAFWITEYNNFNPIILRDKITSSKLYLFQILSPNSSSRDPIDWIKLEDELQPALPFDSFHFFSISMLLMNVIVFPFFMIFIFAWCFHFSHKCFASPIMEKIQANKCPSKMTKGIAMAMHTLKNVMQTFTRKISDVKVKCDV